MSWRWLAVAGLVLGLLAAGFAGGRAWERPRAFKAGQVTQDSMWMNAIAKAKAAHVAAAKATEARQEQVTRQEVRRHEQDRVELRAGYAAARKRLRDKAGAGRATGGADLPRAAQSTGRVDEAGCADDHAVEVALLNFAEEGDEYRLQVQAWQEWALAVGVASPE